MEENNNIEGDESGEEMSSDIINEDANTNDLAEISFHAFFGNTTGTTMKLQGTLNGRKVLLLVNSGSSHNFISQKLLNNYSCLLKLFPIFEFRSSIEISYVATACAKILL